MKTAVAILLGVLGCAMLVVPSDAQVVTKPAVSSTAAGHSVAPVLSSDGRFVVFQSHANNLVTNDDLRPFLDLFVRDLQSSNITLISVDRSGAGGGTGDSSHPAISENGRLVLFASQAGNLVDNDTNETSDVFQRDIVSGVTTLVSVSTNGTAAGRSRRPVMTPDGQSIVFESAANDLALGDLSDNDLFIRDMRSGVTRLVTQRVSPPLGASQFYSSSIATNGRRVAFVSTARNLGPPVQNINGDVYLRDLDADVTVWVSTNLAAYFRSDAYRCLNCVISADGRQVAFKAVAFEAAHLFVHQIETGLTTAITPGSRPDTLPVFSADGRWIAFEQNDAIYMRDLVNATNLLVTAAGPVPADGISLRPVLTPDAQHVAFVSSASNLRGDGVPLPTNVFRIYVRDVSAGATRLISMTTNNAPTRSDMYAVLPAISADAGRVAFDTDAADIVTADNNRSSDVFVRELGDLPTRLVSARHEDRPAGTGRQSGGLSPNSISTNGQRIAFSSLDDPRVPGDTNRQHDVFVHDLVAADTSAISDPTRNLASVNEAYIDPIISADGQSVLYLGEARAVFYQVERFNLLWKPVSGGAIQNVDSSFTYAATERNYAALSPDGSTVVYPRGDHLWWKSIITGSTGIVSDTGSRAPAGPSRSPALSHDGRFVAFPSAAAFLLTNAPNGVFGRHMYVRDLESNTTRLLSIETNGTPLSSPQATAGVFSGNDRYVVYDGAFTTNQWPRIYRFDMETGENLLVCTNCRNPAISFDGQTIAYNGTFGRLGNSNIFVLDMRTGESRVITRDSTGNLMAAPYFDAPLLSADGRYVVFASAIGTLVPNDTNRLSDIFVHDRVQGTTTLISRSRFGPRSAAGQSTQPVMARDGRTVFFQSFAGDIAEGDYNERRDIFVVRLGVGDSDNDGMEDDWEVAHFGDLSRDGAGDRDSDGHSDLQEFLAGTDPTNGGSILRVLTVTPVSGESTTVIWSAVLGRDYIVQYKDSLDANWTNASQVIEADSTSMSFAHNSSSPQRFYRVIAVQ